MSKIQNESPLTLNDVPVSGEINASEALFKNYQDKYSRYFEFAQSRTNFQIEKFIGLEDSTIVHSYATILHQTRVMNGELLREAKEGTELVRNFELKWPEGEDNSKPKQWPNHEGHMVWCWYDLDLIAYQFRTAELKLNIKDKLQQLDFFYKLLAQLEKNNGGEFTKEQYENEAPKYWSIRFKKQVFEDLMGNKLGISGGNIRSLLTATAQPILPDSKNTAIDFPNIFNDLVQGKNLPNILNSLMIDVTKEIATTTNNLAKLESTPEVSKLGNKSSFENLGVVTE